MNYTHDTYNIQRQVAHATQKLILQQQTENLSSEYATELSKSFLDYSQHETE